jgi:hypothetical protein
MAKGETKSLFLRNSLKLIIRVPLVVAGMTAGGLVGLLIGRAIAGVVGVGVDMTMVTRLIGLPIATQLFANIRCFLATGAMILACVSFDELAAGGGTLSLALQLIGTVVVGVAAYLSVTLACWLIAGRPRGPESEAIDIGRAIVRRIAGDRRRLPRAT